jgi:hypothetical protein
MFHELVGLDATEKDEFLAALIRCPCSRPNSVKEARARR